MIIEWKYLIGWLAAFGVYYAGLFMKASVIADKAIRRLFLFFVVATALWVIPKLLLWAPLHGEHTRKIYMSVLFPGIALASASVMILFAAISGQTLLFRKKSFWILPGALFLFSILATTDLVAIRAIDEGSRVRLDYGPLHPALMALCGAAGLSAIAILGYGWWRSRKQADKTLSDQLFGILVASAIAIPGIIITNAVIPVLTGSSALSPLGSLELLFLHTAVLWVLAGGRRRIVSRDFNHWLREAEAIAVGNVDAAQEIVRISRSITSRRMVVKEPTVTFFVEPGVKGGLPESEELSLVRRGDLEHYARRYALTVANGNAEPARLEADLSRLQIRYEELRGFALRLWDVARQKGFAEALRAQFSRRTREVAAALEGSQPSGDVEPKEIPDPFEIMRLEKEKAALVRKLERTERLLVECAANKSGPVVASLVADERGREFLELLEWARNEGRLEEVRQYFRSTSSSSGSEPL